MALQGSMRGVLRTLGDEAGTAASEASEGAQRAVGKAEAELQRIATLEGQKNADQEARLSRFKGTEMQDQRDLSEQIADMQTKLTGIDESLNEYMSQVAATSAELNGTALLPMLSAQRDMKL